jgi:hypothetical protein
MEVLKRYKLMLLHKCRTPHSKRRAIAKGLSDDVIVDVTGLSPEQVQALRAQERPPANGA